MKVRSFLKNFLYEVPGITTSYMVVCLNYHRRRKYIGIPMGDVDLAHLYKEHM